MSNIMALYVVFCAITCLIGLFVLPDAILYVIEKFPNLEDGTYLIIFIGFVVFFQFVLLYWILFGIKCVCEGVYKDCRKISLFKEEETLDPLDIDEWADDILSQLKNGKSLEEINKKIKQGKL